MKRCEMSFFSFIVLIFHITPSADTCHKLCLNGGQRHGGEMSRAHVWPEWGETWS